MMLPQNNSENNWLILNRMRCLSLDLACAGNLFKDSHRILGLAVEFVCMDQSTSGRREREGREERETTCPSLGHTHPWFIHNNDKVRSWACQPPWSLCWLYPHLAPLNGLLIYHKRQGDRWLHMKSHIKENGTLLEGIWTTHTAGNGRYFDKFRWE